MIPESVCVRGLRVTIKAKRGSIILRTYKVCGKLHERSLLTESTRGIECTLARVGGVFAESESSMTDERVKESQ